jgi:hypothetical protein
MSSALERAYQKLLHRTARAAAALTKGGAHDIRVGGKKMRAIKKTHVTKNYKRDRIKDPKGFDPRSFRVIDPGRPGHTKMVVACPKGFFKQGRCRVGMQVQAVLREK